MRGAIVRLSSRHFRASPPKREWLCPDDVRLWAGPSRSEGAPRGTVLRAEPRPPSACGGGGVSTAALSAAARALSRGPGAGGILDGGGKAAAWLRSEESRAWCCWSAGRGSPGRISWPRRCGAGVRGAGRSGARWREGWARGGVRGRPGAGDSFSGGCRECVPSALAPGLCSLSEVL